MTRVLVIGATGQLGLEVSERLVQTGRHQLRVMLRRPSESAALFASQVDVCKGDLRDPASLVKACRGVDIVVATATVVFPKGNYSFHEDEKQGYENLIQACLAEGVSRLIFISLSVPFLPKFLKASPTYQMKHWVEQRLRGSSLSYTILRCAPFMDDYFALIGSAIPLHGERAATLQRASGPTRWLRRLLGRSIEQYGFALVPGNPSGQHAFVALKDVGLHIIAAIDSPSGLRETVEVTGPEALSWHQVGELYSELLGRPVVVYGLPAPFLRLLAWSLRPWSEALSNQLAILWILGHTETRVSRMTAERPFVLRTSARYYLNQKLSLAGPGNSGQVP